MTSLAGDLLEERRNHRRAVIRQAVIYTPLSVGVLALLSISLWSVINGQFGALIAATILALIALAVVFQSVAALRDLGAQPTATAGMVRRAWTKGMFLGFIRSHYILVQRAVFDISIVSYTQLAEGDEVEVRHWPYTKTVIEVRKLKTGGRASDQSEITRSAYEPKREQFVMPDSTDMMMSTRYGGFWWFKLRDGFWRRWRR
ncbi:MAG: hypothetical protein AB7I38_09340 [Dehalococcoidia bacterium]